MAPLATAIGMALAFAGFGVMLVHRGWPRLKQGMASRHWPCENGRIENVRENVRHFYRRTSGAGASRQGIEYIVTFGYVVTGHALRAQWKSPASSGNLPGACPFKEGQVVSVYYDPAAPDSARLFRGVTLQDAEGVGGGVCAFVLSALLPIFVYLSGQPS